MNRFSSVFTCKYPVQNNRFIVFLIAVFSFGFLSAQNAKVSLKDGFAAEGYDVVAYFNQKALKGKKGFQVEWGGVNYQFANEENLKMFKSNPEKFIPQYGGWCAYAMAKTGEKVSVNPKTFEIREGKLYLFYNAFFNNTLASWKEEGPELLRTKADENWDKLIGS